MDPKSVFLIEDNTATAERVLTLLRAELPVVPLHWLDVYGDEKPEAVLPEGATRHEIRSREEFNRWIDVNGDKLGQDALVFYDLQLQGVINSTPEALAHPLTQLFKRLVATESRFLVCCHSTDLAAGTVWAEIDPDGLKACECKALSWLLKQRRDILEELRKILRSWRARYPDSVAGFLFSPDSRRHFGLDRWFAKGGTVRHNWIECLDGVPRGAAWLETIEEEPDRVSLKEEIRDALVPFVKAFLQVRPSDAWFSDLRTAACIHDGLKHLVGACAVAYAGPRKRALNVNGAALLLVAAAGRLGVDCTASVNWANATPENSPMIASPQQSIDQAQAAVAALADELFRLLILHKDTGQSTIFSIGVGRDRLQITMAFSSDSLLAKLRAFPQDSHGDVYAAYRKSVQLLGATDEGRDARCALNLLAQGGGRTLLEIRACP